MSQINTCWSCHGPLQKQSFFCDTCGCLQRPFPINPFNLFEVPIKFEQDLNAIERKYFDLQKQFHPDKFINQPITTQMIALSWVGVVNNAYDKLKCNIKRSIEILEVNKVEDVLDSKPSADLMLKQFELREQLDEEIDAVKFLKVVKNNELECLKQLKQAHITHNFDNAKELTIELQFLTKFIKDVKRKVRQQKMAQ